MIYLIKRDFKIKGMSIEDIYREDNLEYKETHKEIHEDGSYSGLYFNEIHETSGYLALVLLGVVIITGVYISLLKILKFQKASFPFKIHKLAAGLFIAVLLPHTATTEVVNGYFTLGAFLMGLTLAIALSIRWFSDKRNLLLGLKVVFFLIGSIILLIAHFEV